MKLRRCAHCGSEKVYHYPSSGRVMKEHCVECDNCYMNTGFHETPKDATDVWNDRWRFWQSKGGKQMTYKVCSLCKKKVKLNTGRYFHKDELARIEKKGWLDTPSGWFCPSCVKKLKKHKHDH